MTIIRGQAGTPFAGQQCGLYPMPRYSQARTDYEIPPTHPRGPRMPIMQDTKLRISGFFHSPQPRMRSCLESVLRLWQHLFPHGFARTQSDGSDHRTSPRAHGHLPRVGGHPRERLVDSSHSLRGGQAIQIGLHSSPFCFDLLRSPIRVELSPNINCVHRESSAWIETGRLQKTFYS